MNSETIVAPATPYGFGGIAVVRISGPHSILFIDKLINNNNLSAIKTPQHASLVNLYDANNVIIDEAVVTFFKSPNSYTGEDLVEISCHGNPIIVEKIISALCVLGARIAEPGEFTRRAFINGKMDLIQAEAVASLIHSRSEESSHLNLRLLHGELSIKMNDLYKKTITVASLIEFELDISEDNLQPNLNERVLAIMKDQIKQIKKLLSSHEQARLLNYGALVVIAGSPNVGKSTLLNTLSETDRAITSKLPGTTRDAIDVPMVLDGVPINLIDTAGIRQASEEVEQEGVSRSIDYINKADLILLLSDIESNELPNIDYPKSIPLIKIVNKADLLSSNELALAETENPDNLYLSAKTGLNILLLKQQIKAVFGISRFLSSTITITTSRQRQALNTCLKKFESAIELLYLKNCAYELVSIELREALDALGNILGKTTPNDILNNIFNQFCVGK